MTQPDPTAQAWEALARLCMFVEEHLNPPAHRAIDIQGVQQWIPAPLLTILQTSPRAARALNRHASQQLRSGTCRDYDVDGASTRLVRVSDGTGSGMGPWLIPTTGEDHLYWRFPTMEHHAKTAHLDGRFSEAILSQWMIALTNLYPSFAFANGHGFEALVSALSLQNADTFAAGNHRLRCATHAVVYEGPLLQNYNLRYGGSQTSTRQATLALLAHQHGCTVRPELRQCWINNAPPSTQTPDVNTDGLGILRAIFERTEPTLPQTEPFPAKAVALFPPVWRELFSSFPASTVEFAQQYPNLTTQHVGRRIQTTYDNKPIELVQFGDFRSGSLTPMGGVILLESDAAVSGEDWVYSINEDDMGRVLSSTRYHRLPALLSWSWALVFCRRRYPASVEREADGSEAYALDLLGLSDVPPLVISETLWARITDTAALFTRRNAWGGCSLRWGGPVGAVSVLSRIYNQTPHIHRSPVR
ncbi:MAG: hypothetical protein AAFV53_21450 [Myxococcota bacterium]